MYKKLEKASLTVIDDHDFPTISATTSSFLFRPFQQPHPRSSSAHYREYGNIEQHLEFLRLSSDENENVKFLSFAPVN